MAQVAIIDPFDGLLPTSSPMRLVEILRNWTVQLELPKLHQYGMQQSDIARVVAHGGSMKTHPIELTDDELSELLQRCW